MADDVLLMLKRASEGLLYPSEADAPFEPFRWAEQGPLTAETVAALTRTGRSRRKRPVEEVAAEEFFGELGDAPDAGRYRKLLAVLRRTLSDLTVFRVGAAKVDVYIVGRDAAGAWVGLHTTSVET